MQAALRCYPARLRVVPEGLLDQLPVTFSLLVPNEF
jgi:hypothetical protein